MHEELLIFSLFSFFLVVRTPYILDQKLEVKTSFFFNCIEFLIIFSRIVSWMQASTSLLMISNLKYCFLAVIFFYHITIPLFILTSVLLLDNLSHFFTIVNTA